MNDINGPLVLDGLTIATYTICYRINDGVKITDCLFFTCKKDFTARQFCSLDLQRNLIYVDMIFPNILADITLEAFLGNVHTFLDYISFPKSFKIVDELNDAIFYNLKIREFIKLLLFSDIQEEKLSKGTIYCANSYSVTDLHGQKQIFNCDESSSLVELMLQKFQLVADRNNAWVTDSELFIRLDIKA